MLASLGRLKVHTVENNLLYAFHLTLSRYRLLAYTKKCICLMDCEYSVKLYGTCGLILVCVCIYLVVDLSRAMTMHCLVFLRVLCFCTKHKLIDCLRRTILLYVKVAPRVSTLVSNHLSLLTAKTSKTLHASYEVALKFEQSVLSSIKRDKEACFVFI